MPSKLLFNGKPVYTFTDEDRDILVRCLDGEAGDNAAVGREGLAIACCMINRWTSMLTLPWYRKLLLQQPKAKVNGYATLADLIHAYSQPVNYAWLNGGRHDLDPAHVSPEEARRAELLSRPIDSFPQSIRDLVDKVLAVGVPGLLEKGTPPDMTGIVHFYMPCLYYARHLNCKVRDLTDDQVAQCSKSHFGNPDRTLVLAQPVGVSMRSNAFYTVGQTKSWNWATVRVASDQLTA